MRGKITYNSSKPSNRSRFEKRLTKKELKRVRRKFIIRLIGKSKTDKRTLRKFEATFSFMSARGEFTATQVIKNVGLPATVFYEWLDVFCKHKIIEKTGEEPSAGALGKKDIFLITPTGKILTAFLTGEMAYLDQALISIRKKEQNNVMRFGIDAFLRIDNEIKSHVLEGSLKESTWLVGKSELGNMLSEGLLQAVTEAAFSTDPKMLRFARENMELIENQDNKATLLLLKYDIESHFLTRLIGEKLDKYVLTIENNPKSIHFPCSTLECNNVITLSKLTDIPCDPNTEVYCFDCKQRKKSG